MISILLQLFVLSKGIEFPKYSYLFVGPSYSQEYCDEYSKSYKDNIEGTCREMVEEDPTEDYDICVAFYSALQEVRYSKGSDINDQLKKFSKANEIIIIVGSNMAEMDFNNLKDQMKVVFEYDDYIDYKGKIAHKIKEYIKRMIKTSFDGSDESFLRMLGHNKKKSPKLSDEPVLIRGGIKNKVSFLGIDEGYIKFTQEDIDVHSLGLQDGLDESSTKIRTNFLITFPTAHEYLKSIFDTDLIQVEQYSLNIPDYSMENEYTITYNSESWDVSYNDYTFSIPYSLAQTFNLISYSKHFTIVRGENVDLEKYKPINITVVYISAWAEFNAKQLAEEIIIESSGWDNVDKDKRPKLTLTYDPKEFEYKPIENSDLIISPENKYSYKPLNRKDKKVNVGLIVGIVVACVVVVAIVIVVVVIVVRKKKGVGNSSDGQN